MLAIYHNIFHKTKLYCKWKWHHGIHCKKWGGKLLIQSIAQVGHGKGKKGLIYYKGSANAWHFTLKTSKTVSTE